MEDLKQTILFRGMDDREIESAKISLQTQEKTFEKDALVFLAGSTTDRMGLVLSGSVTIESNDLWGNRTILGHIGKGQFFAETYALLKTEPMLVDVVANEKSRILFLRIDNLQNESAPWQQKLLLNLLRISAQKNLHLSGRSFHTAPKSIRGRVMAYLNTVSLQQQKQSFDIPFDRQQLADYLNVERTALSKELGRMQRDGVIRVKKNHFVILSGG